MKKGAAKAKTQRKASKVRSAKTRNITERIALQESEAKIHSILDTVVDGVITIDGSGAIRSFNPAAERLFGYKFKEIVGQNVKILMPEPYHSEHDGYLSNYMRTGKAKIIGIGREVVARRKDGTTFPIDLAVGEIKTADSKHMFTGIVRDITERKQAEEMLRESENRYRSLFDDVGDGIYIRDLQGHFLEVNRVTCETLGYSRDELLHMTVKDIDAAEYAALFEKHTEGIQEKGHLIFETAQVSRNGRVRQTEVSSRLIRYKNQPAVLSIVRDITEGKRLSEAMDLARQYAENIVSTVRDPMVVLDSDLRIVSASRSFYENFKVNPKETEGKSLYEIGNRQWDNPELRKLLTEILPAKSIITDFELTHVFPTIGEKVMLLNARKVQAELGREPFILLAIEDITERKRMSEAVDLARQYAENIVSTVRDPMVVLDSDLRIVSASRSFYENFKVNPKETEGKSLYEIGNRQWDNAELRRLLTEILPAKSVITDFELVHVFPTIGEKVMLLNARKVQAEPGREPFILLAIEDITERKLMETMKDRFISAVTHELRTPLVPVKANVDFALSGKLGPLPEKVELSLQLVKRNIDRLASLTDELLDIRRLESGKFKLNLQPLDFRVVLKQSIDEMRAAADLKKQSLRVEIPDEPLPILGDSARLGQVLLNLLANASKFTPENGSITVKVEEEADVVKVQVSDTGLGLRPQDLTRVFEPFAAIEKPAYIKGTGLGLSLTKSLVETHGGKIWVESAGEGKGATFTFSIPKEKKSNSLSSLAI